MSDYEEIFRRKELHDMFSNGEVRPLDDLYLVEDAALTVQELTKKIDFYKGLKKKKSQDISDEMKVVENKIKFFKEVIISTLAHNKEKTVKFPGSCAVSARNQKGRWKIEDEEEFITVLQEAQKAGEDVSDVLEVVTQYNVRKIEAGKLLDTWEKSGKLEGFLKKAKGGRHVVGKEAPKTTVALKFFEPEEEVENVEDVPIPVKAASGKAEDYDTL